MRKREAIRLLDEALTAGETLAAHVVDLAEANHALRAALTARIAVSTGREPEDINPKEVA